MKIIRDIATWKTYRAHITAEQTIGFVPTMGCLHTGHAALIKKSIADNQKTVVSIFVNPTQFNDSDDYKNYPKTEENDCLLLETLGVDAVLIPSEKEMYADHFTFK